MASQAASRLGTFLYIKAGQGNPVEEKMSKYQTKESEKVSTLTINLFYS